MAKPKVKTANYTTTFKFIEQCRIGELEMWELHRVAESIEFIEQCRIGEQDKNLQALQKKLRHARNYGFGHRQPFSGGGEQDRHVDARGSIHTLGGPCECGSSDTVELTPMGSIHCASCGKIRG